MSPIAFAAGLLPVLLFLVGLMLMDSYQLVARRVVLRALLAGAVAALLAFLANLLLLQVLHVPPTLLKRYLAPVIEETLKVVWIVVLIRRDRVGFLVDAGILGFAVGAGFALVENLYYAQALADPNPILWLIRGPRHRGDARVHHRDRGDRFQGPDRSPSIAGLDVVSARTRDRDRRARDLQPHDVPPARDDRDHARHDAAAPARRVQPQREVDAATGSAWESTPSPSCSS